MSTHKCRVPGCTVCLQTKAGIELHEQLFHGYNPLGTVTDCAGVIEDRSGLMSLTLPITQQVAFIQDEIFIQESLGLVTSS